MDPSGYALCFVSLFALLLTELDGKRPPIASKVSWIRKKAVSAVDSDLWSFFVINLGKDPRS